MRENPSSSAWPTGGCVHCINDTSHTKINNGDEGHVKGGEEVDGTLIFENLLTGKMPPAEKDQPDPEEKRAVLAWLAKRQGGVAQKPFRRISRHEFVHSANDLLGTNLDLTDF